MLSCMSCMMKTDEGGTGLPIFYGKHNEQHQDLLTNWKRHVEKASNYVTGRYLGASCELFELHIVQHLGPRYLRDSAESPTVQPNFLVPCQK
jgi:hypothetical protein